MDIILTSRSNQTTQCTRDTQSSQRTCGYLLKQRSLIAGGCLNQFTLANLALTQHPFIERNNVLTNS